eukprot:CAMPEP_0172716810 /NCGR_PEP_ID=MMETSP1074-20121228/69498_1 /TAXON_ID=2916 /ORGANISM="Ceratium fusus, Strain PA161109" /LENGTH=40 /DNA_ID= /DNA_START= /DNA_END= /DNA_ORIENTATION=
MSLAFIGERVESLLFRRDRDRESHVECDADRDDDCLEDPE